MGRPRTKDRDLPPRMRRKHGAFHHVVGGVWTKLGPLSDLRGALHAYAEREGLPSNAMGTVAAVWERFTDEPGPLGLKARAPRTQKDYEKDAVRILKVFGKMQIGAITSAHVRHYLDHRVDKKGQHAPIRATREKALLSLLITCARSWGVMHTANPCDGIKGWKAGRDRYVTDDEYLKLYDAATEPVQDALCIALATGQRPADVRKMRLPDIRDGIVWVEQGKTKQRLGVKIEGVLKAAIDRSRSRADAAKVTTLHLLTDANGQPYNAWTLRLHMRNAVAKAGLKNTQLRDMRSKAATDMDDLARAQKLLGHRSRATTEGYIKGRRGDVVEPFTQTKNKRQ